MSFLAYLKHLLERVWILPDKRGPVIFEETEMDGSEDFWLVKVSLYLNSANSGIIFPQQANHV